MNIPQSQSAPLSIEALDAEAFRRKLAGLADPLRREGAGANALTPAVVKDLASRFCSILADLFGESLDRLTLWERIGSALATASAEVADDDADRFASLCLEHVRAGPGRAAAHAPLGAVLGTLAAAAPEDRHAFLGYIRSHSYAVLVHGRARWEQVKSKEIEL